MLPDLREAVARHRAYLPPGSLPDTGDRVMEELIEVARELARPPVSNFHVGAVGRGASGALYLGFNVEFPGQALGQTIHAEQSVVALAVAHGETRLERLALSAAPCGHCRQFLGELQDGAGLRVAITGQAEVSLQELLPYRFGPSDLGLHCALLSHPPATLPDRDPDPLVQAAREAAARSYAPYSGCLAGVALLIGGEVFSGSYAENAAFNPSLSPLQAALVSYFSRRGEEPRLERAVLAERTTAASQLHQVTALLKTLAPGLELVYSQIGQKA